MLLVSIANHFIIEWEGEDEKKTGSQKHALNDILNSNFRRISDWSIEWNVLLCCTTEFYLQNRRKYLWGGCYFFVVVVFSSSSSRCSIKRELNCLCVDFPFWHCFFFHSILIETCWKPKQLFSLSLFHSRSLTLSLSGSFFFITIQLKNGVLVTKHTRFELKESR